MVDAATKNIKDKNQVPIAEQIIDVKRKIPKLFQIAWKQTFDSLNSPLAAKTRRCVLTLTPSHTRTNQTNYERTHRRSHSIRIVVVLCCVHGNASASMFIAFNEQRTERRTHTHTHAHASAFGFGLCLTNRLFRLTRSHTHLPALCVT